MGKKSILSKFTDKVLSNQKVAESVSAAWQAHMSAFGPILEPAFEGNDAARIELIAALNMLNRKDVNGGLKKLKHIQKFCKTDADRTAWLFFVGLALDLGGDAEQAVAFWAEAAEYEPKFYLLYLKLARYLYLEAMYEDAQENYEKSIDCLINHPVQEGIQNASYIAAVYTNMASNLTMMHQYEDAKRMLDEAEKWHPGNAERLYVWAILYALMADEVKSEECLQKLKTDTSFVSQEMITETESVLGKINERKHPHYFVVPGNVEKYPEFWEVFCRYEKDMANDLKNGQGEGVVGVLGQLLQPLFPFMQRELILGIMIEEEKFTVELSDFYVKSLHEGYKELLKICPESLKDKWEFTIIH